MTSQLAWELFEPEGKCTSPRGHDYFDVMVAQSTIPVQVTCPHCFQDWTIVVMPRASV